MKAGPPRSTLFPYTPLVRSPRRPAHRGLEGGGVERSGEAEPLELAERLVEADGELEHRLEPAADGRLLRGGGGEQGDRKSTRLNSSHANISYAVFCLKKEKH